MLLLGADFVAQNFDKQYRDAASSASTKIEAVLSGKKKKEVRRLIGSMRFVTMTPLENPGLIERLKKVRSAMLESKTLKFEYFKRYPTDESETATTREVDPYVLTYLSGNWLVGGYDHFRKALRSFRLSRMEQLEITEKSFARPKRLNATDWGKNQTFPIHAKLLFDRSAARWVLESKPYFVVRHKLIANGLLMDVRTNNVDQLIPWLLSWGGAVKVLSPAYLQKIHAEQAQKIFSLYSNMLT
jgi:predicted DNA-binding transcriptional regulator YafY